MKKSQSRPDRRCVKTKKAIKSALAKMMTEKDIARITIKDIADVADINRKTFYAHYTSVYDILDEIENEIAQSLTTLVHNLDFSIGKFDAYLIFEKLTVLINEDFEFYKYLLQSKANSNLLNKLKTVLTDSITDLLSINYKGNRNTLATAVEFVAAGTLSVYQQWFNSDRSQSLEDLSKNIGILAFNGFNTIIEAKKV